MKRENWTAAGVVIDSIDINEAIPIGSVDRFAPTFYWGRLDFYASRGGNCLQRDGDEWCPDNNTRDVPHLRTPSEIQDYFGNVGSVLVVIDSTRLVYGNVEPSLHQALDKERWGRIAKPKLIAQPLKDAHNALVPMARSLIFFLSSLVMVLRKIVNPLPIIGVDGTSVFDVWNSQ